MMIKITNKQANKMNPVILDKYDNVTLGKLRELGCNPWLEFGNIGKNGINWSGYYSGNNLYITWYEKNLPKNTKKLEN